MKSRVLDPSELAAIVNRAKNAEARNPQKRATWPSDEQREDILIAVLEGRNHVKLGKRSFGIRRREINFITGVEPSIYIWPLDGNFIPCGEFQIKTLYNDEVENETEDSTAGRDEAVV